MSRTYKKTGETLKRKHMELVEELKRFEDFLADTYHSAVSDLEGFVKDMEDNGYSVPSEVTELLEALPSDTKVEEIWKQIKNNVEASYP